MLNSFTFINQQSNYSVNCKPQTENCKLSWPAKLKHLFATIFFLTLFCQSEGQSYSIIYRSTDANTSLLQKKFLQTTFQSKIEASTYIILLPSVLKTKGYITASVDSVQYDSTSAVVSIYLGEQYKWAKINTNENDNEILNAVQWPASFNNIVDFTALNNWQKKILNYLEDNGHPFGKVFLDSIEINRQEVTANLKIEKGPTYKIDSIVVYGDAKVNNDFLQRFLEIPNGSLYSKKKLQGISKKLSGLNYVQEERYSNLTLLASGSVLNLYLKAKKSSQVNALIGFQPNSDQVSGNKNFLLTVDANILLRNALGSGETIGLVWQQLQQKSPRLNLLFEQPYIFHSPFGFNFSLDMYKKDSNFLNINLNIGTSYRIEERQTATVFLQRRQSIVSGINTAAILQTRKLPQDIDVSSLNLGVGYTFTNTDYRFNPRKGNELTIKTSGGTKTIKKNNLVLELKDPGDPSFNFEHLYDTVKLKAYQFRIVASGTHFIPLGGQSTIKVALNTGIYQSANYFRNELFQIGGYKLLRGFDEESQFVSQYVIATLEYRYRLGLNSYFFTFSDGGWGKHLLEVKQDHTYISGGIGLAYETKAGIINLAWALGKRDDTQFNLRQSKVHVGFLSYF